jgi:hypothetical protein
MRERERDMCEVPSHIEVYVHGPITSEVYVYVYVYAYVYVTLSVSVYVIFISNQ